VSQKEVHLVSLSLPPVSTFEKACARCHGSQGSFYGDEFANLRDQELIDVTREMMEGPAFLHPSDVDVRAMVAYHHALVAAEPFVVVTALLPAGFTPSLSLASVDTHTCPNELTIDFLLFVYLLLVGLTRRRNAFLSSECKVSYEYEAGEWNEGPATKGGRFRGDVLLARN
jgi:hypothetical protein